MGVVPLWASIPFLLFLLAIAIVPFVNRAWWERYHPHVSVAVGVLSAAGYLMLFRSYDRALTTAHDYSSFIVLLGSLFVITGGILIRIEGAVTPMVNAGLLLTGAILSNVLGTTGASMLFIRPYLHLNRERMRPYLVVFFIFLVSNIGGALTPIGDPPLFLGYLKGVPFFWLVGRVCHIWALTVGLVLAAFLWFDIKNHRGERKALAHGSSRVVVSGWYNLIFLGVVIAAVFQPSPWREALMIAAAAASYFLTPRSIHRAHGFTFHPITEVAFLFFGIFATMMPTLEWLEGNAAGLGLATPGAFYWGSGVLSSFLDNAPTYLNFLSAEVGRLQMDVAGVLAHAPQFIVAISLGSVFFGAMTYIGNGPNFMVKSIADRAGAHSPSFFGYLIRYAMPILIPIFAIVWFFFLRY
jgi:Na+/H+ antiporter NhaD/arsenite permease-like protein